MKHGLSSDAEKEFAIELNGKPITLVVKTMPGDSEVSIDLVRTDWPRKRMWLADH